MIRTYYWHDRVIGKKIYLYNLLGINSANKFKVGNAGDIFTKSIIESVYHRKSMNIPDEGNRLLCIGSVMHKVLPGDVLCGIGVKDETLINFDALKKATIFSLRGPLSYDVLRKNKIDVSKVGSLLDPGLMIRFLLKDESIRPIKGRSIFIPHYRERAIVERLKGLDFVDIDSDPIAIGREILKSEIIYTSSLHGIIFSHALKRPCVFVAPQTKESIFKYKDYYSSVCIEMPRPKTDIRNAFYGAKPNSPVEVNYDFNDFCFPNINFLDDHGVLVNN